MIGVLTLTPGGQAATLGDGSSVWQRVSCVTCPPTWLADILSNIVLFLPLGAALVMAGVAPLRAVMVGAAASFVIELLQGAGFPASREPALADLASNTIGTAIGVACVQYRSTLLTPTARTENMLRLGWVAASTWMMLGSALALSPVTSERNKELGPRGIARTASFTPSRLAGLPTKRSVKGWSAAGMPSRLPAAPTAPRLRTKTPRTRGPPPGPAPSTSTPPATVATAPPRCVASKAKKSATTRRALAPKVLPSKTATRGPPPAPAVTTRSCVMSPLR